jgi:hypothetical protein
MISRLLGQVQPCFARGTRIARLPPAPSEVTENPTSGTMEDQMRTARFIYLYFSTLVPDALECTWPFNSEMAAACSRSSSMEISQYLEGR